MSESFASANLDDLRGYSERMAPVAQALEELTGSPVEPCEVITVAVEERELPRA